MEVIRKRSGEEVPFDRSKILKAISAANKEVATKRGVSIDAGLIEEITDKVSAQVIEANYAMPVDEIQAIVINSIPLVPVEKLKNLATFRFATEDGIRDAFQEYRNSQIVAQAYLTYKLERDEVRHANTTDDAIVAIVDRRNEEAKTENSNKDPIINSTQRDYIAGEVSKDITLRKLLPREIAEAHKKGIIHFHDSDYFVQRMHNCDLVNMLDMEWNGTVISSVKITRPHTLYVAANLMSQIIAQVSSNQYGGQSVSIAHLAPFVDVSRQKYRKQIIESHEAIGIKLTDEDIAALVKPLVKEEIKAAIQTVNYQLVTIMTTNGQAPFLTVFLNINEAHAVAEQLEEWGDKVDEAQLQNDLALLIEEMLKQRIQGMPNEKGVWVTPAFPKLVYVLDDNNISEGSEYFWLTKLSAECTAKRMVPDYISAKVQRELKKGEVYTPMGCRSFLTVEDEVLNPNGSHKMYGRFNQGVVTINLPYIACLSRGDMDAFWSLLDEYLELCHKALRIRHERLLGTPADVAPILWRHGALARLDKGETIDKLLYGGYSTISLGYAGLYEMCMRMTGHTHTDEESGAKAFALKVMQHLNDKCAEWRETENIAYSLYGTPMESTTYKFANALQRDFGVIKGVSDKNYITNSYHVHVTEEIDAFEKLRFESEFQKLSPGGAISYVEVPNMQQNIPAVLSVMKFIYDNIMYAELNTKSDYCEVCGYDGEIQIVEDEKTKKLVWECPNCGNRDEHKMSVARRTCGYIGTNFWNQGRTQEIKDRVLHL